MKVDDSKRDLLFWLAYRMDAAHGSFKNAMFLYINGGLDIRGVIKALELVSAAYKNTADELTVKVNSGEVE